MVLFNNTVMGARIRRMVNTSRRYLAPIVFAAMIPLSNPAFSLPNTPRINPKEFKDPKAAPSKKSTAMRIAAAINLADGTIVEDELCKKKFNVLLRRHKRIQKKNRGSKVRNMLVGVILDVEMMLEVSKHQNMYSRSDQQRIALSSIKSNLYAFETVEKLQPRTLKLYFRTIGLLGLYDLSLKFRQGLYNKDVIKVYQEMSADICKQKR
jgi:hypothetical protein